MCCDKTKTDSVDNILYLTLEGSSGNINLVRSLPIQRMVLKQIMVTWDSAGDSSSNGPLVNVELEPFSNLRFNSNRERHIDALPVFNDVSSQVTNYSPDISVHADSHFKQSFEYRIFDAAGAPVSNLTSVGLLFSYSERAII